MKEIVDRFVPVFTKESILTVALDSEEKTLSFELEGGDFRMIENLALDKVQEDMNFGIENIRDLKEIIDSCDEISFVKIPTNNSSVSIIAGFGKDYFRMLTTIVEE